MTVAASRPTLLFVVTEDWYFCSHRLPLAIGAQQAGFDVAVATRVGKHADVMHQAGIAIHPWNVNRGSTGVWTELKTLWSLLSIYRKVQPDVLHQVAIKPVLYGSFAAALTGRPKIVNALGGMGSIFNGGKRRTRWLRATIVACMQWLLSGKGKVLILQNRDDRELMLNEVGLPAESIRLILGAGVNTDHFSPTPESEGVPLIVLPARMLWDKGIGEFVEAARILRADGVMARFALVGGIDECNPTGIEAAQLQRWTEEGCVEWFGMRDDMPAVFRQAHIVCLPSYREGLPKSLLEAAASARAIVATDVPGCREIVHSGSNGLLVPARDGMALAAALKTLILDAPLRQKMGQKGRTMILNNFSEETVVRDTVAIYKDILKTSA